MRGLRVLTLRMVGEEAAGTRVPSRTATALRRSAGGAATRMARVVVGVRGRRVRVDGEAAAVVADGAAGAVVVALAAGGREGV
jgi:hypothetical protein